MGNAPRRAERLKRETIGGEEFIESTEGRANPVNPQAAAAEKLAKVRAIRAAGVSFKAMLVEFGSSRELSIARQRIEEAVLWATQAVINERPAEKPQA